MAHSDKLWELEKLALKQDYFTLEYAAKHLGLTERRTADIIKEVVRNRALKRFNLTKKRGRPTKLHRLVLKDFKIDRAQEIFEYVNRIKDKADAVILFGSLITRYADEYSDIDLFVLSKKEVEEHKNIEVLNVNNINKVPYATRFNILHNGIILISKKEFPKIEFNFEESIKLKTLKIESDIKLLSIAEFPQAPAFLGMVLLNMGNLLLLKQNRVPSCWKEVKLYLESFFKEINLLYPYYLKFLKERPISERELVLNKEKYIKLKTKVLRLWKKIRQERYSIPPCIRQAM